MPYENAVKATEEELKEHRRKCWHSDCSKTAYLECWTGYRNCFKHWKMDYKYGSGVGLWFALRHSKIINIFN